MKKFIAGVLTTLAIIGLVQWGKENNKVYYMDGVVIAEDKVSDKVTVSTMDGIYIIYGEHLHKGDNVTLLFDKNGTEETDDDEIIEVK